MSWMAKALTALKAPLMPRAGPPLDGVKSAPVTRLIPTDPQGWSPDQVTAGVSVTDAMAMRVSAFWACARLIASTGGSLPAQTYREDDTGELVATKATPLYAVVHESPNADLTPLDYWEFVFLSLLVRGNHYARKLRRGDGTLIGLDPVPPDIMAVRRRPDGRIGYRWSLYGQSFDLTEDDVFHVRGFGGGPLGGLSTISYARQSLGIAIAADQTAGALFANGARPSGTLQFKDWLDADKRAGARADIEEKFAGAMNAGRPLILEGGSTWLPISMNADDAQLLESRSWSVEDVCRWFGVPPVLIGHNEKTTSWGTGIEQLLLGFVKFTLNPYLVRIEQAIRKQLLTPAERAQGIVARFNLEGLLRGDSAGRAAFYDTMTRIGVMTRNECRRKENLPPVAGGDEVMIQMQYVPLMEAIHAALNGGKPNAPAPAQA